MGTGEKEKRSGEIVEAFFPVERCILITREEGTVKVFVMLRVLQ
jgi:hypothetical protein